jgi:hypothetical protein
MALQPSGQIALSDIMRETSMSNKTDYSLDSGENGQTTIGYPRINLCSSQRPSDNDGCSLNEWYGYDHYTDCNTIRWTAVYNDSNSSLCDSFPTNTPTDSPALTNCTQVVALSNQSCVCIGMDPQIMILPNDYDGMGGLLLFKNYYNNVSNIVIRDGISGSILYTQSAGYYQNGSINISQLGVNGAWLISYNYSCIYNGTAVCTGSYPWGTENNKWTWLGTTALGSTTGSFTLYSQDTSGAAVCLGTNQIRFVYYILASTTSSAAVNTVFYLNEARTILAPAGAYAMANGYKFIVNSSGVVTSVSLACPVNVDLANKYFRNSSLILRKVDFGALTVGNCYLFEDYGDPTHLYVRGILSSFDRSKLTYTIINYSYP